LLKVFDNNTPSFLCDDPETYDYAERNAKFTTQLYTISESSTAANPKNKKENQSALLILIIFQ